MIVTRKMLANKLIKYINRETDLSSFISWAEEMTKEADFEDKDFELLRDILVRIGLAEAREFSLSWDDSYDYLHKLGYDVKVEVSETS